MFKELEALVETTSIHLIITKSGEAELKVLVLPQTREGMNPALCQPLSLEATPDELDEKFASVLNEYKAARKTLEETLEETKAYMEAAGKAARESATTAAKQATAKDKGASPKAAEAQEAATNAPADDEEPDLFA